MVQKKFQLSCSKITEVLSFEAKSVQQCFNAVADCELFGLL